MSGLQPLPLTAEPGCESQSHVVNAHDEQKHIKTWFNKQTEFAEPGKNYFKKLNIMLTS